MYVWNFQVWEIEDEDLTYGNKYQTSYFYVDNIGLKKKDGTIEAYDLGSEVLNSIIFIQDHEQFSPDKKRYKNYQKDMKELQYDMLYGKQYVWNQENHLRQRTFNLNPAAYGDEDIRDKGQHLYRRNNFTNFCQVFDGDVKINTTYNEHLLEVLKKDLKDGDTFKVISSVRL